MTGELYLYAMACNRVHLDHRYDYDHCGCSIEFQYCATNING